MILIAIIGAIVACLCSMIIVKILASRLGDQKLFTNFLIWFDPQEIKQHKSYQFVHKVKINN